MNMMMNMMMNMLKEWECGSTCPFFFIIAQVALYFIIHFVYIIRQVRDQPLLSI